MWAAEPNGRTRGLHGRRSLPSNYGSEFHRVYRSRHRAHTPYCWFVVQAPWAVLITLVIARTPFLCGVSVLWVVKSSPKKIYAAGAPLRSKAATASIGETLFTNSVACPNLRSVYLRLDRPLSKLGKYCTLGDISKTHIYYFTTRKCFTLEKQK